MKLWVGVAAVAFNTLTIIDLEHNIFFSFHANKISKYRGTIKITIRSINRPIFCNFFLKPSLINAVFYFTFLLIFQFRYQSSIATLAKERMFEILIIVFALLSNGLYLMYRWRYCSWFLSSKRDSFHHFQVLAFNDVGSWRSLVTEHWIGHNPKS